MLNIYCPFCRKPIYLSSKIEFIDATKIEVECHNCNMLFKHKQLFYYTKEGRTPLNKSFEEVWSNKE